MPKFNKIIKTNTNITINTCGFLNPGEFDSDRKATVVYGDTSGYGNITFSISGNTLPAGLEFITSNGVITGNATSVLDETFYTITASDGIGRNSSSNISLTVTDINSTYAMDFASNRSIEQGPQGIKLPTSTQLDFGSGDFTIEFYVRNDRNVSQVANSMIVDAGTSSQFTGIGVGTANTGSINFISFRAQSGYTVLKAATSIKLSEAQNPEPASARDTFQHVACVKSGSNGYLFINGILEDSTTSWGGVTAASIKTGYIGRNRSAATNQYFNGVISNFRVTKQALYTSNFTVNIQTEPIDDTSPYYFANWRRIYADVPYVPVANTVLLLNGNSINNLDNSNNRFTFTPSGTDPVLNSRNAWAGYTPGSENSGEVVSSNWDTIYFTFEDLFTTG